MLKSDKAIEKTMRPMRKQSTRAITTGKLIKACYGCSLYYFVIDSVYY